MSLAPNPAAVSVPAGGGSATLQLSNGGGEKIAFKVKSSNNNEYRINPVFGFIEPGGSTPLEITRTAGGAKEDKLVILFATIGADAPTEPKAAFGAVQASNQQFTIPLSAV